MKKDARKKSSDPAQEDLRSHKDDWNSETSKLIGQLISLKKGINGRGDRISNIPPSSIKDPLPNEVTNHLSEVINSFNKIIDHAHSIIQEQSHYSQNRKKSLSSEEQYLISLSDQITDIGLEKMSSWWGSRLKAKLKFFKLNPELRKLKWKVLVSAVDTEKEILKFESSLLNEDLNDLNKSFAILTSFLLSFRGDFLSKLIDLKNFSKKLQEQSQQIDNTSKSINKEQEDKSEQSTSTVELNESAPTDEKDKFQKFNSIFEDIENLSFVILHIINTKLDEEQKKKIIDLNNKFRKSVNETHALLSKNVAPAEILPKIDSIINSYELLLGLSSKYYGLKDNFGEIAESIPPEEINKQANALGRWLNKLKLSILPDSSSLLRLEIVSKSNKFRKKLDDTMNLIENLDYEIKKISENVLELIDMLEDIIKKMITLYKKYILDLKLKSDDKKTPLLRIVQRDEIVELEKEMKLILNLKSEFSNEPSI